MELVNSIMAGDISADEGLEMVHIVVHLSKQPQF